MLIQHSPSFLQVGNLRSRDWAKEAWPVWAVESGVEIRALCSPTAFISSGYLTSYYKPGSFKP